MNNNSFLFSGDFWVKTQNVTVERLSGTSVKVSWSLDWDQSDLYEVVYKPVDAR